MIALAILYLFAMFLLPIGSLPITCGFAFFAGLLNVPILPSSYSFATKITGQMPPAVVNGLMMSGAQLYSFAASLFVTFLLSKGQIYGLSYMAASMVLAATFTVCIDIKKQSRYMALFDSQETATNASVANVADGEIDIEDHESTNEASGGPIALQNKQQKTTE